MRRAPNGRPIPFKNKNGGWEVFVNVPRPNGGAPSKRHLRGATKTEVARKMTDLIDAQARSATGHGPTMTVLEWLDLWIEGQSDQVRPSTIAGYRTDRNYIAEHIGGVRLTSLSSEQIERMYRAVRAKTSVGTAQHLHRTLNAALRRARKRGHLSTNPAEDARVPRAGLGEIAPKRDLSVDEIGRLIPVMRQRRNAPRWTLARPRRCIHPT